MDAHYLVIVASSSDTSVTQGSNASDFTVNLALPLVLQGRFEACVRSINYPKGHAGLSVFVLAPGLVELSDVGSSAVPLILRLPPTKSDDDPTIYYEQRSTVVPWFSVRENTILNRLRIQVIQSDDTPIPHGGGKHSTIELVFRRVV
jgi:hypothetical protein